MSAGGCGDASAVQGAAVELFQIAALLMGNSGEAVSLVEETLASIEIDPCLDPGTARKESQQQLMLLALGRLRELDPESFQEIPEVSDGSGACVQDEDLHGDSIAHGQLAEWLAADGRRDLRSWLAALPAAHRVIFVQRAILGAGNAATAQSLDLRLPVMPAWTPEAVGEVYRRALCSLANSLAHAPAGGSEALLETASARA